MPPLEITSLVLAPHRKQLGYLAPITCCPDEFLAEVKRLVGDRPIGGLARRGKDWWAQCPAPDL